MDGRRAAAEFAATVERPIVRGGMAPPDVIDVAFPDGRRAWRDRVLLLCALAVAGVTLAAAVAWQLWPQSRPAPTEQLGRGPTAPRVAPPATPAANPPASAPAPAPRKTRPAAPAAGPRVLRAGSSGPDVTDLQRLLFDQGFTYVSQTGVYDAETVRGVRQLQSDRGLICDPDGVYGICTRAALTS